MNDRTDPRLPALIPWPRRLTLAQGGNGRLALDQGLRLVPSLAAPPVVQRLLERQQRRLDALLGPAGSKAPLLTLAVQTDAPLPFLEVDERYLLKIDDEGGELSATSSVGASHGLERLLQAIDRDASGTFLRAMTLDDGPRFPWRGLLLDLARHHLPLDVLLRTLDGMAALGLNVLHLHLNDDQGFRIEAPSCPELHLRSGADGHLARREVDTLVRAAADRGIRVVPELDVPGHAGALLWARPDLAAGTPPDALPRAFGPGRHALDPTLDATWEFLDGLVGDLAAQFPDAFLHLGGDEVHPDVFAFEDARRRVWMADHGVEDSAGVQAWFVGEMVALLARHERRAVGWDEVLHPAVPEALVVQSWRGAASLRAATAAGHDALFSSGWYLDLMYPAGLHYAFDPAADGQAMARAEERILASPALAGLRRGAESLLQGAEAVRSRTAARPGRILGGEACLWSELVTAELLDVRLYGRLPAVAERLWSPADVDDEADHYRRLPRWLAYLQDVTACWPLDGHLPLLARLGIGAPGGGSPDDRGGSIAGDVDGNGADEALLGHVETLMAALEPARWYRRLLGPQMLAARLGEGSGMGSAAPQRPYDADTPLQRIVDLLPPESLDVRAFAEELEAAAAGSDAAAVEILRARARRWRVACHGLAAAREKIPEIEELGPQLDALAAVADLLDAWLTHEPVSGSSMQASSEREEMENLATRLDGIEAALPPHGEVTLAVLAPLRARFAA